MEHCRHEDSIALVKSVLRLPNRGYRFHAFKGGAILGRHRLSRVVLRDSEVGRKGGLVSMIGGLASGKRFTGRCCETVIGFCPYPMARDLELHSLASANGTEGDCRERESEETLERIYGDSKETLEDSSRDEGTHGDAWWSGRDTLDYRLYPRISGRDRENRSRETEKTGSEQETGEGRANAESIGDERDGATLDWSRRSREVVFVLDGDWTGTGGTGTGTGTKDPEGI